MTVNHVIIPCSVQFTIFGVKTRVYKFNHRLQLNKVCHGGSPLGDPCTLMCLFRFPLWLNRSRHNLHSYGFSPLCIRKCLVRVLLSEKAFLHRRHLKIVLTVGHMTWTWSILQTHLYGLSPEWVLIWVVTEELCENLLSQTGHLNGFSPEWVRTCAVKLAAWENDLLQSLHRNGFSPLCVLKWVFNVLGRA